MKATTASHDDPLLPAAEALLACVSLATVASFARLFVGGSFFGA